MPTIGSYSLYSIETGQFGLDGGAMFGIVPKPLWSKRIEPDDQNRIPLNMRCLLLAGTDRVILIDTGVGDTFEGTKYQDIYAVDHGAYTLDGSLDDHGFARDDVTDVILTHLHFDHGGGSTRRINGEYVPSFPNATYHVQRDHWQWAQDPNPKEQGSFIADTFRPIEAAGQLNLLDGEGEIFPGIALELVHGHTESQQTVKISGDDRTLVYVADLLPTTHHLLPAWTMAYDVRPLQTIEEKGNFLERAENAEWNLFFEHDPHVSVGNLDRTDRGIEVVDRRPLEEL